MENYYDAQDEVHIVAKETDGIDSGQEEAHTNIIEAVEGKIETKKRTLIVENESTDVTKQCRLDYFIEDNIIKGRYLDTMEQDEKDNLCKVEKYYDAQDEIKAVTKKKGDTSHSKEEICRNAQIQGSN